MIAPDLSQMVRPIDSVHEDKANARTHDDRNVAAIAESLATFGQRKPIIALPDGTVIAGNGTLRAARMLGWDSIAVATFEDEGKARAFAIADNRTAELAKWDETVLAQTLDGMSEELRKAVGFDGGELDQLLAKLRAPVEDKIPEPPANPVTKPGDLWLLGKHRLVCGDSTKADDVARVMNGVPINVAVTSPPYAEQREYDVSSGFRPIAPDEYGDWWEPIQANIASALAADGSFFVNIKAASNGLDTETYVLELVLRHVKEWGWHWASEFCWERGGIPQEPSRRFKNQFEPVYQFTRGDWKFRPAAVRHSSDAAFGYGGLSARRDASDQGTGRMEWSHSGKGLAYPGNRLPAFSTSENVLGHPAVFPVGLPAFFISAYSDSGDSVFDPFSGSGSTIIASENLDRIGHGIELSPAYCDVIVQRWETATGGKATRG